MNTRFGHFPRNGFHDAPRATESAHAEDGHGGSRDVAGAPLPPTRAARSPRSRGRFFDPAEDRSHLRKTPVVRAWVTALAVAACGITMTLLASAPSLVSGTAFGANPGPGIVASASVAPSFVHALGKR